MNLLAPVKAFGRWLAGDKPKPGKSVAPRASYDAAKTFDENKNHWANADSLSANAANSLDVRVKLRTRSRYERANNGYAKGLIRGRTNDTVGTGARLQIDLPEAVVDSEFDVTLTTGTPTTSAADLARRVEKLWCEWAEAVGLPEKARLLADAEDTDGEGFALLVANDKLPGVRLDLRVIECDRVTTPGYAALDVTAVDGVVLDDAGQPVEYHVLRQHPGDGLAWAFTASDFERVPARQVIHLFDRDRPEQARGIPILTPALPLYAIMRRYTLASLGSAELGAMISGVIESQLPPDTGPTGAGAEAPEYDTMDAIPFARNLLMTLPGGYTAKAFDSKNPSPSYREFKSEVLTEAGRAAGENRNTATGSSAEYNYSSGRLDHLPRQRGIKIRRERFERHLYDRLFRAWLAEAETLPGYLPAGLPAAAAWEWRWHWDGFESIDPVKDATAAQILKEIGLTTDADELAKVGKDWREHYAQLKREQDLRTSLGIVPPAPKPAAGQPAPAPAEDTANVA